MIAPNDALRQKAVVLARKQLQIVTSAWVMTEVAAYLSDPLNRMLFTSLLGAVRNSVLIEFISPNLDLFDAGVDLYNRRSDKAWSLVDCISFVIMQREQLTDALTGDHHFVQAGFKALLL